VAGTAAIFFDVDFTLIYPGPRFQGVGYSESCARHGLVIDETRFHAAVALAGPELETAEHLYDAEVFIGYTRRIIELMGGRSPVADTVAREMYDEWASDQHFSLYDDVRDSLEALVGRGVRLGLISNSHRCLESFQAHFGLDGLISVAISSADLGYMKPHPAIFQAALDRMGVNATASMMVGDSLVHDVIGARQAGMRAVLLARGRVGRSLEGDDVPVIRSLRELPDLL
jgi:putative hydrolase of the HAD superfamily